jgi:hypothetical protein
LLAAAGEVRQTRPEITFFGRKKEEWPATPATANKIKVDLTGTHKPKKWKSSINIRKTRGPEYLSIRTAWRYIIASWHSSLSGLSWRFCAWRKSNADRKLQALQAVRALHTAVREARQALLSLRVLAEDGDREAVEGLQADVMGTI